MEQTLIFVMERITDVINLLNSLVVGPISALLVLIWLIALYFIPAIIAGFRHHRNTLAITVLTLMFGWTFLGWVIALVWAFTNDGSINIEVKVAAKKGDVTRFTDNTDEMRPSPKQISPSPREGGPIALAEPGRRMNREEKIKYMLNDLTHRGVNKYTAAPPLYRALWRLGFDVAPPVFGISWPTALLMGVFWGVGMGCLWWLLMGVISSPPPLIPIIILFGIGGILWGLFMAAYFRARWRKLELPRWEDYPAASI